LDTTAIPDLSKYPGFLVEETWALGRRK